MTYRRLEHTSEMGLSRSGESAEAVFEEATVALGELLATHHGLELRRKDGIWHGHVVLGA